MTWMLIMVLAGVLLLNRYLLLEPNLPLRLPLWVQQCLRYSAPCLLTAICGPIILNGYELEQMGSNPYVYATFWAILSAYFIRNMLVSVLVSLFGFYVIMFCF